ncbi:hypothetical protein SAMN05216403_11050 [Nitrosospira multiformis ATCC 25196]|uniref:Uncharacterized protein n=1 Tax=Nitrosospira multiformis (strain ATCC 25196 / NCIMB 11849 / C 71) TaxID=323848 RepID=A0A1H5V531_NITMU|nr:hypothetical protein [Nitrosospira multiformis]SEF81557.1 hypothetical protein SAMN05216403_11050 [Nitrosospira multiformis ATCC 25196]
MIPSRLAEAASIVSNLHNPFTYAGSARRLSLAGTLVFIQLSGFTLAKHVALLVAPEQPLVQASNMSFVIPASNLDPD